VGISSWWSSLLGPVPLVLDLHIEKTVTYILDVLGKLGQHRVALMDAMRVTKDTGDSSLKDIQT
jgi:hypothetical protein